ncbi:nucleotidyltransferase domain-containing protein [Clostridium botulinum]|uniref:nucleotidyltransferase domain-containing protein n=1 Tax=Clostridium botulinum TaxID=1491 RepID=UPI0007E04C80|nr:nucleotidyltransferase domain-containing protein [Clostridium botulinum]KEI82154.1 nucleotidyltransferase [Clostridium botulinum B2 331]NFA89976.1 nucleotidyltransferase domain-containing protein [Clostridium botulinum]NFB19853.1 nucleotidyltransferase domain-containing protein [Clostridium botulinum]NFI38232.1 nucleotidyltransferase domain-containing protein [Clostridium botulinum]NFT57518.1 nucleotidyltransferase domain-containing protein [Clostridium botulinum]
MNDNIIKYQTAFNNVIDRLKNNESVLAVMVFGSMVTGDLWEESDIDLFVVTNEDIKVEKIYTQEEDVPIHVKIIDKKNLDKIYQCDLRGGKTHRIFASSRLVFSKDSSISSWYDRGRYYPDIDRERWNLVYLGEIFKYIGVCKKYLKNRGFYTAYSDSVKLTEAFSKLYVNFSGYMISKDVINMATSLDDDFKNIVDDLFFNKDNIEESIIKLIEYIKIYLNDNIRNITSLLLNYMKEKDTFLSSQDILMDDLFKCYSISMEDILEYLYYKNIIKKHSRKLKNKEGELIFQENVYFI